MAFYLSNVGTGPEENDKKEKLHFTQRGQDLPSASALTGLCQEQSATF